MNDDVKIIILCVNRGENKPTADTQLFGRSLEQWVRSAMRGMQTESLPYEDGSDVFSVIRSSLIVTKPYTVVLFSDTPLVTYNTVTQALEHLKTNNLSVVRLPRGYVLDNSSVLSADSMESRSVLNIGDDDFFTVHNYNQLAYVTDIIRSRINYYFMDNGVEIIDPASTFIDVDVMIDAGVRIEPFVTIKGKSVIKSGTVIRSHSVIEGSVIDSGCTVTASTLTGALLNRNVTVGPYAHLRKGTVVEADSKIGDYVEIKSSRIGSGSKVNHLAYVGDADIGSGCNIGAGVIFANYDGKFKRRITLGDKVFVGSNATLVAPLDVGSGAFIAGGSVITDNVPAKSLSVCRARQFVKENWENNKFASSDEDSQS